ncbi:MULTISPECIES: hypothetical protein [Burkholderia]|uniref:hypothetical protein n=1 Tax=Burkholderia TaxID=32008 RepID=UPI001048E9C9|nr:MULTISPECIES: hypothetical protein [Burkholderia]ELK6466834.1 hypothetical protein [Burkholderia contaminans]MCA7889215.1 hypothetical protein [Burkholderia contaminans]TCW73457.1 hypothetical protein C5O79_01200 [Burkholderia sp. SRS-25]
MTKLINFNYLRPLYYFLLSMTDDELDDFYINTEEGARRIYEEAKAEFSRFGPVSQERVIDVLEYVLASNSWLENWKEIIPQEVPLDDVDDKMKYVHDLFVSLAGREPSLEFDVSDVEVTDAVGPEGLAIKK